MKVVLSRNQCLPAKLERLYANLKGYREVERKTEYHGVSVSYFAYLDNGDPVNWRDPAIRSDVNLVNLVESGEYKDLVIIEIPDGVMWYLGADLSGQEMIIENHRTWSIRTWSINVDY